jgi:type I restriction enzyme S subunit
MSENIPNGWKWVKVEDFAEVVSGGTPSTDKPEFWNGDIAWITPKDLSDFKFRYISRGERNISRQGLESSNAKLLPKGTVLLSSRAPVGYLAIAKNELTTNQGFQSLVPKENVITEFLYYLLKDNVEYLKSQASGTTFGELSKSTLKKLIFPLPPLPEQKAIAEVLSSIDDKIDLLHRQNKTLEEMAMTLFRQWFIKPTKDGLPEGWEEVEIGDILKETIGGDWGENEKFEGSISVFCLRGIDLDNIKIYGHSNSVPIRYVSKDSLEKRTLTENQILLAGSGIGPIGKTLPIHRKMISSFNLPVIYSNFCKRLEAKNKEIAYYMEFFIFYMYRNGELDQFHSGTSIPNFNMKNFLKLKIYFPPIIDIIKFSNFLDMFYSKKFSPQIQTLEKLRDTLLPKLMSGEVRVKV